MDEQEIASAEPLNPSNKVEFEFGSVMIKLNALRTLSVGHMFETTSQIDRPVIVRCDGSVVASGQVMVDENGSLVVQVTEVS